MHGYSSRSEPDLLAILKRRPVTRRPQKISGPQKEDNRPPLHLLLFFAFVNCHPQPVTLLLPLLLLRFVFLLPSPLRNCRRSSALASSPLLAHGSFLLLLRDPNGSLFPPRCPHPDPQVLLPCRGGDLPTPRRCRHYLLVAIRWPERLSARVQVTLFAWGSCAVVS